MPVYLVPPLVHTQTKESNRGPLITAKAWPEVLSTYFTRYGPPSKPTAHYSHGKVRFNNRAEAYLEGVRRQYWPLNGLQAVLQSSE